MISLLAWRLLCATLASLETTPLVSLDVLICPLAPYLYVIYMSTSDRYTLIMSTAFSCVDHLRMVSAKVVISYLGCGLGSLS